MVDDFRNIKDSIFRSVIATLNSVAEGDGEKRGSGIGGRMDASSARELLSMAASWAGKGKDEIVQMICREIGLAVAAMIKEPLTQVLENRKLQISMELVPKEKTQASADDTKQSSQSKPSTGKTKTKKTPR